MAKKALTPEELRALPMEKLEKLLKDQHVLFVFEYLRDFNGTQAAIRAGYEETSAASQAWKLLRRPEIKEYRDRKIREIF
ncbi:terminase small subunit [Oscillibacter sp.]|uniref:terminase small subunit n=1 Tax=Oscillibacter sp. TaxID=1945593 RepID=UPI0028978378|nr:terminase small subunit [Oscillibacter sp.]